MCALLCGKMKFALRTSLLKLADRFILSFKSIANTYFIRSINIGIGEQRFVKFNRDQYR